MIPQDTTFWKTRPSTDAHMDWPYTEKDWIKGYEESVKHPHRAKIIEILKDHEWESLLEIGCSVGPNLKLIHQAFPKARLYGIDPNKQSVERAQSFVDAAVREGDVRNLMSENVKYDVILADASLMYVTPAEIRGVMDAIAVSAKKLVIIVDRYNQSKLGKVTGGVWGRDYRHLLRERGFTTAVIFMTKDDWPTSPNWVKHGRYFVGLK